MNLKAASKNVFLGTYLPNEYVCLAVNTLEQPLEVIGTVEGRRVNLTGAHILLGYKPLLIGLFFPKDQPGTPDHLVLDFVFPLTAASLAQLTLRKIHERHLGTHSFYLYEGVHGDHRFLSPFYQSMNQLYEFLRPPRTGNVGLPGNLYEQVRIGYSIPRGVSVISLGDGDRVNFFPTDLHGAVGGDFYVGSLRHEGMATRQVESNRKITISTVEPAAFRETYALGKNHMREPRPTDDFRIREERSPVWNLPVPEAAVASQDLSWLESLDVGIHRIHFYRTEGRRSFIESDILGHVHRYYAEWRNNQGLPTRWLIQ